MKKLLSKLTITALTLTCLNTYADDGNNKPAFGASFSSGEANTGSINFNKIWSLDCRNNLGAGIYLDGSAGYTQHVASGEKSGALSMSTGLIFNCSKFLFGPGVAVTKNTSGSINDDVGAQPMVIFGYNGESARIIGKVKMGFDKHDNQGNEKESKPYTNLELGVSKTF